MNSDKQQQAPETTDYKDHYSDSGFWQKLKCYAKDAGSELVEKALLLYYAAQQEGVPAWARATIIASLGYFITPLDAIVDLTPVVGYSDDLGVLALAVATVAAHINDRVRAQAKEKVAQWFGSDVDVNNTVQDRKI